MAASRDRDGRAGGRPARRADASSVGLLLIDFINPMDFEGAEQLLRPADDASKVVRRMRAEADRLGIPTIYVNDNHGQWRAERTRIVDHCLERNAAGAPMVRRLAPRLRDYFVLKPHLSGFYATSLPILLPKLGISRIVLTGVAADICVLFTAADGHMRDYDLWIPADAVASETSEQRDDALALMRKCMDAETRPTSALSLAAWARAGGRKQTGDLVAHRS